jgi:hypothetical protein
MKADPLRGTRELRRRLAGIVRERLASNANAAEEHRRTRYQTFKRGLRQGLGWLLVLLLITLFGYVLFTEKSQVREAGRLGVITWMLTGPSLYLLVQLQRRLFQHPEMLVLTLLPIGNPTASRRQFAGLVWPLVGMGFLSWVLLLSAFRLGPFSVAGVAALPVAVATTLCCFGFALLGLRWAWVARLISLAFTFGTIGAWFACSNKWVPNWPEWLDQFGWWIGRILPTGWATLAFHEAAVKGAWAWLLLPIGLAAVLAALLWRVVQWLIGSLLPRELILAQYAAQLPEGTDPESVEQFQRGLELPKGPGETAILDEVMSTGLLAPIRDRPTDFLTRRVWQWWTPRERLLAEWGYPEWPTWARTWQRSVLVLLGSAVAGLLAQRVGSTAGAVLFLGIGTVLAGFGLLPISPGPSRGLSPRAMGNGFMAGLLVVPVTWSEVRRMAAKAAAVRLLAALPVVALAALLWHWVPGLPLEKTAWTAAKVVVLSMAVRSLLLVMAPWSGCSVFGSGHAGVNLAILALVLVVFLAFAAGIACVVMDGAAGLGAAVVAWGLVRAMEAICAWLWSRRLLSGTPPSGDSVL